MFNNQPGEFEFVSSSTLAPGLLASPAAGRDGAETDASCLPQRLDRRDGLRRIKRVGAGAELRIRGLRDETGARRPLSEQCRRALAHGAELLAVEGGSLSDVVRVVYVVRNPDSFAACYPLLRAAFEDSRPAVVLRMVSGFDRPDIEIEVELTAHLPG